MANTTVKIKDSQDKAFKNSKIVPFKYTYTKSGDLFIAPDGTEFDDEDACKTYEVLLSDKEYKLSKSILVK